MCGIAGYYNPNPGFRASRELALAMARTLTHRGPDDEGAYADGNVALAQRRLSIIDIEGGNQPISNEDRSVWVVFNGEIFNYIELRNELIAKGHRFATKCDTEVLVHAYEQFGQEMLEHLNGQFAIALWDKLRRRLFLARDRLGIRPLYYSTMADNTFVFGSEMKAILAYPGMQARFDPVGIGQALTFWATVPPRTSLKGLCELAPGCSMAIEPGAISTRKYWSLSFPDRCGFEDRPLSYFVERLRDLMRDSVKLRLRADVPVAAYISGGLDSTITASLVKQAHGVGLMTFGVTFDDPAFDESRYQRIAADYLGTDHRSVAAADERIGEAFGEAIRHAEMPITRTAPAPLYMLSHLVRESGIKVVVTGEGADEVFGGYNIFKEDKIRRFWARQPASTLRPRLLSSIYPYISRKGDAFWQAFFARGLTEIDDPYYSHRIRWNNSRRLKWLFSPDIRASIPDLPTLCEELDGYIAADFMRWHPLCRAQYLEMVLFMSGHLLSAQADRMMMGNSVEGRFPFLDHRVVEFAAGIPPRYKVNCLNEKYILKKAFADCVPEALVRREKQPYRAPVARCFAKSGANLASSMLSPSAVKKAGLFDAGAVGRLAAKAKREGAAVSAIEDMAAAFVVSTQLLNHHFGCTFS